MAASMIARTCISRISGYVMHRRQPRCPSIGFDSCSCSTRRATTSTPMPSSLASSACLAFSCGTNSCSGGSINRIVTGRPSIAWKMPTKSRRWNGSSLSSALTRASLSFARIISWMPSCRSWLFSGCSKSVKNMCSVRQRPMPSAPNSMAFRASCGVSALVRTFSVRMLVGPLHDREVRLRQFRCNQRHLAAVHNAFAAVERQPVAFLQRLATLCDGHGLGFVVDVERVRANDAALAPSACNHCRVTGLAASRRQECPAPRPCRPHLPGWFRGERESPSRPSWPILLHRLPTNTILPTAAPGTALMPVARMRDARDFLSTFTSMTG